MTMYEQEPGFIDEIRSAMRDELTALFGDRTEVDNSSMAVDAYNADNVGEPWTPPLAGSDDPIAVRIIREEPAIAVIRPSKSFTGTKTLVSTTVQRVVNYDPQRRSVTLVNQSTNRVAFADGPNVQYGGAGKFGSAELMPLTAITLYTIADIWMVGGNASGDDVTVIQEFEAGR